MADINKKILIEFNNIERIICNLPGVDRLQYLNSLELAGVATYLHNFYNGVENILKIIFKEKKIPFPSGESWHKELIETAEKLKIISKETRIKIGAYLAFRHFFSHAYALDLDPDKLEPLIMNIQNVFNLFKKDIFKYLNK